MTDNLELAAFRAVWREVGDLPYGPARSADYVRPDGTLDIEALRAADAEADRLNDEVVRRAVAAALFAAGRDHRGADQAHRDDLARDAARAWVAERDQAERLGETDVGVGPGLADALDRLAAAYRPDLGGEVIAPR